MIAEILSVGTELLMGQIANTDAQFVSRRLSELGISLYRHTAVGDNPARIRTALGEALARADIVITTGGLGPTGDDVTRDAVAAHFGLALVEDAASLDRIAAFLGRVPENAAQRRQALFPEGATILPNRVGTAPGCIVEAGGKAVAMLPGPPRELRDMFDGALAPWLARRSGAHIASRFLHVSGMGEPQVEAALADLFDSDDPTLALYCAPGEITVRATAMAADAGAAAAKLDPVEREIRRRLGARVYAEGRDADLEHTVVALLRRRGEHVSAAESLTGGMVAARLVNVPGASNVLDEAHVTYADRAKHRVLGVRQETLDRFTAVSAQCAREMAEGVRRISGANWGIATTGYAGPDGGADGTPPGTVYVAVAGPDGTRVEALRFPGDRDQVRTLAASWALDALRLRLEGQIGGEA